MSIPTWVLATFAAVMLLVAEVSAGQLMVAQAGSRRDLTDPGIAASRLLAGIALAGILLPGLRVLPNAAWAVAFAVITAWFAWCLWRENRGRPAAAAARGKYAPHLVHSAAMVYLFAALAGPSLAGSATPMPSMPGMPGMAGGTPGGTPTLHAPTLALILALLLIAFTVRDLDQRASAAGDSRATGRPPAPTGPAPTGPAPTGSAPTGSALAAAAARLLLSPAAVKGCQVATGVTVAFILVIMI
jgi:Domain of unknown function (DUF5134)